MSAFVPPCELKASGPASSVVRDSLFNVALEFAVRFPGAGNRSLLRGNLPDLDLDQFAVSVVVSLFLARKAALDSVEQWKDNLHV
jgi:hypothetical protein